MWPFKRKKATIPESFTELKCPYCQSRDTQLKVNFGNDQPDYIKTWRGERYLTYHCFNCETDFSISEPATGIDIESQISNQVIDDEAALKAAEDELKRDMDENGDHRYG